MPVSEETILYLLSDWRNSDFIEGYSFEALPKGHKINQVYYDYERRCFMFVIEHESFEIVPLGFCPTIIELTERKIVKVNYKKLRNKINYILNNKLKKRDIIEILKGINNDLQM